MSNQKSQYRKVIGAALISSVLLLTGCGELKETTDKAVDNVEDVVQSVATSADPKVQIVKESYPEAYPRITIGEAFDLYFSSPKWKYFTAEEEHEVVEFTGYFLYEEVEAKATIQFLLQEDESFEVGAVSYNDLPQNELATDALLLSIFEEAALQVTEVTSGESEEAESPEVETNQVLGQVDMPIQLGESLSDLTSYYGDPTYDDYFMGGRLVVFEEKDGYFLSDAETVTGYMISNPYISIFEAYIGMNLAEVTSVLSEPAESFFDDTETQSYVNVYYIDNYKINFYSDTESGPTTSAIIIDNNQLATNATAEQSSSNPYEWTPGFQSHFETEILDRGYIDSVDSIRYEEAYVDNGEGHLTVYAELDGTEYAIVTVNVKTGDFSGN
ncbi:hypothetical protein [Planomicrobium okeanokoites]|uniref:hypothetical protein n=1 Tax=Planomicrobium okeanokoites TaxID=244 RepID=UPI0030FAC721